jgi:hypothetical protein
MFSRWFGKASVQPGDAELGELRELCRRASARLEKAGFTNPALSREPRPFPHDFHHRLDLLKVFAELIGDEAASKSNKDLLWRFCGKMRMTPESDVMDRIEDEDIIEVYDMNGDQIFRNLHYFSVVSLSVEDLVCMNWKRDFKRSAKVTLELVELLFRFATGRFGKTFDCTKIPVHIVEEQMAKRHRIELTLKLISPLKIQGKCEALLVTSRARILNVGAAPPSPS